MEKCFIIDIDKFIIFQLMQSDEAIKISSVGGVHTLLIENCIIDDDGQYVCKAKNPGGQASTRTSVQVTGKKYKQIQEVMATNVFRKHLRLGLETNIYASYIYKMIRCNKMKINNKVGKIREL